MVEGVEFIGTLAEISHIILQFTIMEPQVNEPSQTSNLDFKRADFKKLRERLGRIPVWKILKNEIIKAKQKHITDKKKDT